MCTQLKLSLFTTNRLGTAHQSNLLGLSSFFPDSPSDKAVYVLSRDWDLPRVFTFRHCLIKPWRNHSPCPAHTASGDSMTRNALLWPEALALVFWVAFCVENKPTTYTQKTSTVCNCFSRKYKSTSPLQQGCSFIGVLYWNNCRIYSDKHLQQCN